MTPRGPFKLFSPNQFDECGFSYLEILITIMLLGMFFLPVMQMLSSSVSHLAYVSEMNTALSLAREGMEKVRNLRLSENQLLERGDVYDPPLDQDPLELNGTHWRILQDVHEGTDPLEVHVQVFKEGAMDEPMVEVQTLIEEIN